MVQELGETAQQMFKDDDQEVQDILNRRPSGHYWIVIHHKATSRRLTTGEQVIVKLIKDYDTKPNNLVGTVILEIKDGEVVSHSINLPDAPIDWGKIEPVAGFETTPYLQQGTGISDAYVYNF